MKKKLFLFSLFLLFSIFSPNQILASTNDCPATLPYSFCYKSSEAPNKTCMNMGESADCGGIATQLVLWCCATDEDDPVPADSIAGPRWGCDGESINTALGCIPVGNMNSLVGFFLRWAIGIGGGIAFFLILVAGFQIMTSTGDPKRLQAGKELLTSAIAGLILLIFSVFILKIIGVDILQLPGLE